MSHPVRLELNKAKAVLALTPPARRAHRAVLTIFVETGLAPTRAELERTVLRGEADPRSVLAELADRDVVAFDSHGEVRAAYPFSPCPTAITVTWNGGPAVFAMCAVDALGVSRMLDRSVMITAAEPDSGETVIVQVDRERASWRPATAVVFTGSTDGACCPSVDRSCGHINFFTTGDAAQEWAKRHPDVAGAVLDQDVALACAIAEFGDMLR